MYKATSQSRRRIKYPNPQLYLLLSSFQSQLSYSLMSDITAAIIRTTLGEFDTFVRVAVENGNLDKISAKEGEIVSNIFIAFITTQKFFDLPEKVLQNLYAIY